MPNGYSSPMVWETGVQSQIESYERLKNGTWCPHYKVRIKGKAEKTREWSSVLPYTLV